jgi:hypothetical protein
MNLDSNMGSYPRQLPLYIVIDDTPLDRQMKSKYSNGGKKFAKRLRGVS